MNDMYGNGGRAQSVMVVDDDRMVSDLICEVSESLGFKAAAVYDGDEFPDAYRRLRPDIIVLDLNLPGHDGIELMRYLGEQYCRAKIFLTSGVDARTLSAAEKIGEKHNLNSGGILPKPITVEALENALRPLSVGTVAIDVEDLRNAVENDEFVVRYQPKITLLNRHGDEMDGAETLIRWNRPGVGLVGPDEFLSAVRRHDMMAEVTKIVFRKAVQALRDWIDLGLRLTVSVNLDGTLLDDLQLPDRLREITDAHDVPANHITVEITESAAMADPATTQDILTRLRVKQFNVSMDDFGTGYSSLVQLYRLPFNELKIDKSFVMDIGQNAEADAIVEVLAMLGSKLGLKVCAEGVETQAQLDRLRAFGCDLGQGYLFSKPVEASMIAPLAREWGTRAIAEKNRPED